MTRYQIIKNILSEGLMLPYKKVKTRYFDRNSHQEFPKSEINYHREWYKYDYDIDGNAIYYETNDGWWAKYEYDQYKRVIYYENSNGDWEKFEYDQYGNEKYYANSSGFWKKTEYDANGNKIYYENSDGVIEDNRNQIQEGLALPYRKKITYAEILPHFKKFSEKVEDVFTVHLFEYTDHMGGEIDLSFQVEAEAGFYDFNYYWSYVKANYINLHIWHIDFDSEYEKDLYDDTIKINDLNDLVNELTKYTNHINDDILPNITEYYG